MNTRIRVFLTVVSLIFAGLLTIQFVVMLLLPAHRTNPTAERQRVMDRPTDPAPAVDPPRTPSGRSLIRHAPQRTAQAG